MSIIDGICWEQNVEKLIWFGKNVLSKISLMVGSDVVVGPDAVQLWVIFKDMPMVSY